MTYLLFARHCSHDHFFGRSHDLLRLLDYVVDLGECGRLSNRRTLDDELQLLHADRNHVELVQQLLLQRTCRHLFVVAMHCLG